MNILVAGGTGRGKSYVAGLLAERLIDLGYRLVVIDPEGDHVGLGRMRDTFVLGGHHDPLPRVDEVVRLLRYGACSLVLDLSTSPATDRERYISQLTARLDALRTERGLPHWIVRDEAHLFLRRHGLLRPVFDPTLGGYCLVTYRPDDLSPEVVAAVDVIVSTTTPVDTVIGPHCLTPLPSGRPLSAQMVWPNRPDPARTFTLPDRGTPHTRHRRKYAEAVLPPERRFHFRTPNGGIYTEASTLTEFEEELARCDSTTVGHHLLQWDFSRWVIDVLQDPSLGSAIATIERDVTDRYQADLQRARARIRKAIERRYLTRSPSHGPGRR